MPAINAPIRGASQKNHSCAKAQPPTINAGPVLLAGFTEVLVTGMLMRCINVKAKPMAKAAKPLGARSSVAPKMVIKNIKVMMISVTSAETMEYWPGNVRHNHCSTHY